jgi:hypothetical protein
MVQQHRSVLAQHTFPFEGRLDDEVGRGRSGNDGIPQESFADRVGSEKNEDERGRGVAGMKNWLGGSCDAKSKTGREDVSRLS